MAMETADTSGEGTEVMETPAKWAEVAEKLRSRGMKARWEGMLYLYLMVAVVAAVVWVFTWTSPQGIGFAKSLTALFASALEVDKGEIDWSKFEPSPTAQILAQVGLWVLKGGAVFLAIYLTQIMVGFVRYQLRMYHLLNDCADALELSEGNVDDLEKYRRSIATDSIEFGKIPQSQIDKLLDTIKEISNAALSRDKS